MIVLLDNVLQAYDDPVLLFFHYMMYVSHDIATFQLLSTKETTIQEYLTSLSVSGDYLAGKFGPRDFRYIIWKNKRFGPAFGANNERFQDYVNFENDNNTGKYLLSHKAMDRKFLVVDNAKVGSIFGLPSLPQKTEPLSSGSSTFSDRSFGHNITPMLNASVIETERFLEIWEILSEAKMHFKLPHEIGVDPVRRLIRILRSALKHFPRLDSEESFKDPYWVCDYFLLTEDQEKSIRHLIDRLRTERIGPPLVAISTLIAEFQQDIVEMKASRFLKDSIPVSEFARYCILVRHSIFSSKAGSRKDLILFWDEVWKEWLNSTDEERSKKMLGCAGVHRSWADDDEMRLFVESREGSEEEECFADDSFARSFTGGSQDGGLELIKESESEDTFVEGIDMTASSSKIKKLNYVDEPILSDSPPPLDTGSTESFSRDIFDSVGAELRKNLVVPATSDGTKNELPSELDTEKLEDAKYQKECVNASANAHMEKTANAEIIEPDTKKPDISEDSFEVDGNTKNIEVRQLCATDGKIPVAELTPILEQASLANRETVIIGDVSKQIIEDENLYRGEEARESPTSPPVEAELEEICPRNMPLKEEREVTVDNGILHTDIPGLLSEVGVPSKIPEADDDELDSVNEITELGENIDETIQHTTFKDFSETSSKFKLGESIAPVPIELSDEVQTVYNDTDAGNANSPTVFGEFDLNTDLYKQPGALTAVLDVSSSSSSAGHSDNESEDMVSPAKSVESRDESIPEKIEMFEKLGGHKPMQRHLHHTLSNEEISSDKEDGKNVKSILKPVTNRPDNGIVYQLKEFIENKPELISLKSTEDFIDSKVGPKSSGAIKKGRSISEIFAALLDDNMKDLSVSAEYRNTIVRPQDLYNRIKIETDKPWEKLSRRTKERYYGAFLRKYDDALNRPENCSMDIVDTFEIVKVCVDFDDVKHKIVKYAIDIVENKEMFVQKQNSDEGNESDSHGSSIRSVNNRKSYDSITSNEFPSAKTMNRVSSSRSLNSIRGLRLTRDSSSSSILLPQHKIDESGESYEDINQNDI